MLGVEAVGVIERLGKEISDGFKVGDSWILHNPPGAYCENALYTRNI